MFCSKCGKEIADGSTVCPECGATLTSENKKEKRSFKPDPIMAVDLVLSAIAFIFGFIITTSSFVNNWGVSYADTLAILPALVAIGISVYKLFDEKSSKLTRFFSFICVGTAGFALVYTFIGVMVFIG